MSSLTSNVPKGLEGIVATTSSICYIDGEQGVLAYRGLDIHELAEHSSFEEICYLLWFGKLPSASRKTKMPGLSSTRFARRSLSCATRSAAKIIA